MSAIEAVIAVKKTRSEELSVRAVARAIGCSFDPAGEASIKPRS